MNAIYRRVYRAQCQPGAEAATAAYFEAQRTALQEVIADQRLLTVSVFRWETTFFVYYEAVGTDAVPDELFGHGADLLRLWPGKGEPRAFVPMMDIFHCGEPISLEQWQRRSPIEEIRARITHLQPHMLSSYIFYHYQLQEEKPGSFDKYCLISLHENLLFFYQEFPNELESPPRTGKLTTHHTPDDWHGTMFPHFLLWDDAPEGQEIWRDVERVLSLRRAEPQPD